MRLIQDISDLDFIVVGTENEALILENQLIKKHRPKYNILLKDSQGYPYFVLTNHKHPQLKYTYFTNRYKGKYYGPLAAKTFEKKELKNLIDNLFPLRKCNQIPKKKCLYYDIGQCLGPCIKKIDLNVYDDIKKSINNFFTGKANNIIKQLKAKEQQAVKKLHFEEANRIKKTLSSIAEFKKYQTIDLNAKTNIDVLGFVSQDNLLFINLFTYINGKLIAKVQETYEYFFDLDDAITN
ncbi:UvrB/UvrC motif-containing protein [bacterium]|nr:UvrB/UvrC motif-containing protein [bacterium]